MSHKSDAQWTIKALEMALMSREIAPGRVHLSDHSGQYASQVYTEISHQQQIQIRRVAWATPMITRQPNALGEP